MALTQFGTIDSVSGCDSVPLQIQLSSLGAEVHAATFELDLPAGVSFITGTASCSNHPAIALPPPLLVNGKLSWDIKTLLSTIAGYNDPQFNADSINYIQFNLIVGLTGPTYPMPGTIQITASTKGFSTCGDSIIADPPLVYQLIYSNAPSTPYISVSPQLCENQAAGLFVSGYDTLGTLTPTYLWSTGHLGTSAYTLEPDSITVEVHDANGCLVEADTIVTDRTPIFTIADSLACFGDTIPLIVNTSNCASGCTYLWSSGATTQNILVSPFTAAVYTVTVSNGICSKDSIINAFSDSSCCAIYNAILDSVDFDGSAGPKTIGPGKHNLNESVTVYGHVTIYGDSIAIAPGVSISLTPGSHLTIRQSYLYGCNSMWQGIIMFEHDSVTITEGSAVHDAETAILASTYSKISVRCMALSMVSSAFLLYLAMSFFGIQEKWIL